MRRVDDTTSCSERGIEPSRHLFTGNRHVDVHGVAEGLLLVELLHPDGGSVSKRIDRIVIRHGHITEDRTPKTNVDCIALGGDRELHFLDGSTLR